MWALSTFGFENRAFGIVEESLRFSSLSVIGGAIAIVFRPLGALASGSRWRLRFPALRAKEAISKRDGVLA